MEASNKLDGGYSLTIAREGLIYRGANIFKKIDENPRNEEKMTKFKSGA